MVIRNRSIGQVCTCCPLLQSVPATAHRSALHSTYISDHTVDVRLVSRINSTFIPENQHAWMLTNHVAHESNDSDAAIVETEIAVTKINIRYPKNTRVCIHFNKTSVQVFYM